MEKGKTDLEKRIYYRKKLILKIEELLNSDSSLKLYHYKSHDIKVDVISKNEGILVVANENFKELFDKVEFETSYGAKGEAYKIHFKNSYNQCKEAIKSNGNISLNAAMVGVLGPLYDPTRFSNGYIIYDELVFLKEDLYNLDSGYFNKIKDYDNIYISVHKLVKEIYNVDESSGNGDIAPDGDDIEELVYSRNKILFGPPGTGKSYNIKSKMNLINVKDKNITRITFHPEYSYYEFVGQYKPVVAYEKIVGVIRYPNSKELTNEKAFVYYDFVPGPFTKAIIKALQLKEKANGKAPENALLIIEEINRGNSSAVFGDIFQLLDRINDVNNEYYGESEYSIDISIEMKEYIKSELGWQEIDWNKNFERGFVIPSNLYIYSTMNTSDQSLYPMDSAFKRRWDMEYMYIDYKEEKLEDLYLPEPYEEIKWLDFIKKINEKIVNYTEVDDKQLGQWFIGNNLSESEFLGKVISYLWFDIFRYDPSLLFKEDIKTFDDVRIFYDKGIFKTEIIEEVTGETTDETTDETTEDSVSRDEE